LDKNPPDVSGADGSPDNLTLFTIYGNDAMQAIGCHQGATLYPLSLLIVKLQYLIAHDKIFMRIHYYEDHGLMGGQGSGYPIHLPRLTPVEECLHLSTTRLDIARKSFGEDGGGAAK
jgi:hypothetical protein